MRFKFMLLSNVLIAVLAFVAGAATVSFNIDPGVEPMRAVNLFDGWYAVKLEVTDQGVTVPEVVSIHAPTINEMK